MSGFSEAACISSRVKSNSLLVSRPVLEFGPFAQVIEIPPEPIIDALSRPQPLEQPPK